MAKFCSNCGKPVLESAMFCEECGESLQAPQPGPAVQPYTPQQQAPIVQPYAAPPQPIPAAQPYTSQQQAPVTQPYAPQQQAPAVVQTYTPPPQQQAPTAQPSAPQASKSRKLPIILGIAGVVVVGIIIAVILIVTKSKKDPDSSSISNLNIPSAEASGDTQQTDNARQTDDADSSAPSVDSSLKEDAPEDAPEATPTAPTNTPQDSPTPSAARVDPADAYSQVLDGLSGYSGDYGFYDIDNNGMDELIVRYETQYDFYIYIYSYVNGATYEIGEFWTRNMLTLINSSGVIYSVGNAGADSTIVEAQVIADDQKSLRTVDSWEADYEREIYTHTVNGTQERITEQEFDDIVHTIYYEIGVLNDIAWINLSSNYVYSGDTGDWTDIEGKIKIPPSWHYYFEEWDDLWEYPVVAGEGIGGTIYLVVGQIMDMSLDTAKSESVAWRAFRFDTGIDGYRIEFEDCVVWVYEDTWWEGVMYMFHDNTDRAVFADNEGIISAVAATLAH